MLKNKQEYSTNEDIVCRDGRSKQRDTATLLQWATACEAHSGEPIDRQTENSATLVPTEQYLDLGNKEIQL